MIKKRILPAELFSTIGDTMGKATQEKMNSTERYRISKLTMEVQMEIASDLGSLQLPSNSQKMLDKKQPINLFKVTVNAR